MDPRKFIHTHFTNIRYVCIILVHIFTKSLLSVIVATWKIQVIHSHFSPMTTTKPRPIIFSGNQTIPLPHQASLPMLQTSRKSPGFEIFTHSLSSNLKNSGTLQVRPSLLASVNIHSVPSRKRLLARLELSTSLPSPSKTPSSLASLSAPW